MRYRMTNEEHEQLLDASKPVPYLVIGGHPPSSPYDNAMRVWNRICARVSCVRDSVAPANSGDDHDFDADPKGSTMINDNSELIPCWQAVKACIEGKTVEVRVSESDKFRPIAWKPEATYEFTFSFHWQYRLAPEPVRMWAVLYSIFKEPSRTDYFQTEQEFKDFVHKIKMDSDFRIIRTIELREVEGGE